MSLTGAMPTEASKENAVEFVKKTQLPVGTSEAAQREAKQYVPIHLFDSHDGKMLIVQTGTFGCPGDQHRSFLLTVDGLVLPGCADIQSDAIDIKLETGATIHLAVKSTLS